MYPQQPLSYDPKFDALTLYQSFSEELLILSHGPVHLTVPQIDIRTRGGSTQVATPPAIWFKKDLSNYTSRGNTVCVAQEAKLTRSYLPAPYSPCVLETEADVVRSSALWLLHPVVIALQSHLADQKVGCHAEVTIDDCRCDALIKIDGEVVAVIEYKNRAHIKPAEFARGRIRDCSVANRLEIIDSIDLVTKTKTESLMANNAKCLTKQAAAYSSKFGTRYVALFDWDNLFLWHFAGKEFRLRRASKLPYTALDGHARWAYGTPVEGRQNFRKALLGFIMEAYSHKDELPQPPPFEPTRAQKEKRRAQSEAKMLADMTPQQRAYRDAYGPR
ncbi:hypothetical protein KVR01_005751 [Diaporthe batatas]|uniref:uncharacterized protein n=1 Tax=Diaporthe batatas TaxID=748121 RepID=UPI001D05756C|nr:uncharacterized protein KVR01_005751 [Diaporthe batatas]KAG8163833.1 hypothetical protein KVR01_005751 [Diaporthe batatas]